MLVHQRVFQGPEVERKDIKRGLLNIFKFFFVNLLLKFYNKTSVNRTKTVFLLLRYGDTLSNAWFRQWLARVCSRLARSYMTSQFQEDVWKIFQYWDTSNCEPSWRYTRYQQCLGLGNPQKYDQHRLPSEVLVQVDFPLHRFAWRWTGLWGECDMRM